MNPASLNAPLLNQEQSVPTQPAFPMQQPIPVQPAASQLIPGQPVSNNLEYLTRCTYVELSFIFSCWNSYC